MIVHKRPILHYIYRLLISETVDYEEGTIFPFNNKIYTINDLPQHLIVHERVHFKQQGDLLGSIKWVILYIISKKFRLNQEIEAYGAQYAYIKRTENREVANNGLEEVASLLSSSLYGNLISLAEAREVIRNYGN